MKVFNQSYARELLKAITAALPTTPGVLNGAKMHLFTAGPTLNPNMAVADFTEPTYTGYAAQATTWSPAVNEGASGAQVVGTDGVFQPTNNIGLPQIILGAFVTDSASANVYWAELFGTPVVLTTSSDAAVYDPDLHQPPA